MPAKPKPWRISLLLEVAYGGCTLIQNEAMASFRHSKDLKYGTLCNLLDNYVPLVLSIYITTFKLNDFGAYFQAMLRITLMFVCLKRRHYNKAPLVWLSMVSHWKKKFTELFTLMKQWLIVTDEYPVENAHSIIRAQTNHSDTAEQLRTKVKGIFQSKNQQKDFRSS